MTYRSKLGVALRKMLREPLVHFLIAGLAVFAFASLRDAPVDPASRTITITEEQVGRLAARWQAAWRRAPTPRELDALIRDHVKEEVYYREARRLGMDEDDPVIRARLRAKMEYLSIAAAENAAPSEATLQAWVDRHPARYAADQRSSFDQIYLGQGAAAVLAARAEAVRRQLRGGADWRGLGERISLPASLEATEAGAVARQFGDDFSAGLADLPVDAWYGPVESGFGAHLVRLRTVTAGAPPRLADVRQRAENDWRAATLAAREARAYQALLDGYVIQIERP
ncbi:MAG: peptidyl-prolyl cis-trans isomerase [Sphingopyxis sp.]|nr:peptidyl-prolyl cis-trans isomerase [Sphingopyxis sp.]